MATTFGGLSVVDHCTFYNNTSNFSDSPWGDHIGEVKSSIFYPGIARNHVSGRQVSIPYSYSLGDGISGNGNIQGNPLFVDPSHYNFNLAAGSPCIGTGASGSNMGADMSLFPSWMFNFLEHYSDDFGNIQWENGNASDTISLNLTESQFIDVSISNCSQTYTDSIWVEVYNTPNISAGNDTTACLGGLFTLTASGGDSYTWTPSIFNGVPFTVDSAATYIVQGVDSNGCSSSDTVFVSILDPTITAGQPAFCLGDSTIISINDVSTSDSTLIDQFQMNMFQALNHTTPNLVSGENYILKGSGTVGFSGGVDSQDAAYQYNWFGSPLTPYAFPSTTSVWWYVNGSNNFRPDQDSYNGNHIYYFSFVGNNQPLTITWTDNPYGDNSGQLNFQLLKIESNSTLSYW